MESPFSGDMGYFRELSGKFSPLAAEPGGRRQRLLKIFIYLGLSTIYYQFLADPALEVSTLGQPSTTMNPVFTASLSAENQNQNHHFQMPSQLFAAFITLLSLTTCILLCQPFKILFMPSPHYGTVRTALPHGHGVGQCSAERRLGNAPVGTSLCSMR
ncbi:hypothetical protein OUZ56_002187 [Daphnia magna]|uniref:Uncharacterized protein n=1 Tax=Daphnia magna TaxID=35525 RepID=A0ABR0A4X4_9CRUS|nr:hypothetical protein OUZ56_002187 [Daphnia magna]